MSTRKTRREVAEAREGKRFKACKFGSTGEAHAFKSNLQALGLGLNGLMVYQVSISEVSSSKLPVSIVKTVTRLETKRRSLKLPWS